jgi:hypothetical protein
MSLSVGDVTCGMQPLEGQIVHEIDVKDAFLRLDPQTVHDEIHKLLNNH